MNVSFKRVGQISRLVADGTPEELAAFCRVAGLFSETEEARCATCAHWARCDRDPAFVAATGFSCGAYCKRD